MLEFKKMQFVEVTTLLLKYNGRTVEIKSQLAALLFQLSKKVTEYLCSGCFFSIQISTL